MNEHERDDTHLLSGVYALDAVTPEEAALVEAAMRDSEELRSEVVGLSDTAVALGAAVAPETPPAELRGRLLVAIESTPQLPSETERSIQHVAPRRRRRRLRPMALVASAAVAVVLFGGGFLVERTLLQPQSAYVQITQASDVQNASARMSDGGKATVYWSKSEHGTAVVLNGVTVPAGKALQLWSVRGSTITSAGLYEPQAGEHYMVLSGTPSSGESLAVSVEPDGGSAQPTTTPIVRVALDA